MVVINKKIIIFVLISLFPAVLFAEVPIQQVDQQTLQIEKNYLTKKNDLYQMWELSHNYQYGTTVPRDPVKALAWMMIYAKSLPPSYPGLNEMVDRYKRSLSDEQIQDAYQMSLVYRNKYHLNYSLSEDELSKIFTISKVNFNNIEVDRTLPDIESLIQQLRSSGQASTADKLDSRLATLKQADQFPIYYGRVVVLGPERPGVVTSPVEILPGGYFIAGFNNTGTTLKFQLSGYASVVKQINPAKIVQNLGIIELKALPANKLSNVVGRILPAKALEKVNVVLKLKNSVNPRDDDPWLSPVVPITIADGQYYATGLSPDVYELIISYKGQKIIRDIELHAGETKGVDTITL